ncbi:MAG: TROVE domain-containing protein [Defluviitaleaceae bacterium]|nr:TROVE domain-containing protein [Defluviitaleaceae bacterium]
MSKFNKNTKTKVVNKEKHAAYAMDDKERLVSQVLTTFFGEPKFYGKTDHEIVTTARTLAKLEPEFVAKLAVFARREFNMRSVSHVLAAVLAREPKGKEFVRRLIPAIALRADDVTEILSAYLHFYGKPIPNSLKKGINDAFVKFDEYALSKYKGEQNKLKMRDIPRICHPTPKDAEQSDMWKRLLAGELQKTYTWEVELSAKGNNKWVWEELIWSGKVGYMALLRNLRNIIAAKPDNINMVYETLTDPERVRKSRQFPFRFLSAYKELKGVKGTSSKAYDALETALDISVENIPRIAGKTAIVVDVSGSMTSPVSKRSKMTCAEIGLLLGVIAAHICEESVFLTFDTEVYPQAVSKRGGILPQVRNIRVSGGGTYMQKPFIYLRDNRISVDRVIVLSDNQCNCPYGGNTTLHKHSNAYRKHINPDCWVHGIDLQGYGTQQFTGEKTNIISGWSEKVLEFVTLAESGVATLVLRIESVDF